MKVVIISPFSMSGGGSTRVRDLIKHTDTDWRIILPQNDKYGGSPLDDERLYFPIREKSYLKTPVWMLRVLCYLVKFRPDVVHALKPHPFTVRPAVLYKWVFRKRMVFDCDEWDSLTLADSGAPLWQRIISDILAWFGLRFSDSILYANSLVLKEKIPSRLHGRCYYVPNGVDKDEFKAVDKPHTLFNIFFVGMLAKYRHIAPIVEAVEKLADSIPHLKCNIVGGGAGLDELKRVVGEEGLSDLFVFHGLVEHDKIPLLLSEADVLVAPFRDLPGVRYQCNMKLFEYMGMGKPIIATDVGDIKNILGDAAVVVPAGEGGETASAIADAVRDLADNPGKAKALGKAARVRAEEKFDWRIISENLLKAYRGDAV